MSILHYARPHLVARALVVSLGAVLLLTVALVDTASAHGSVVDPASRNYGCLDRWGGNHLAPEMQTQDPMCYQAFQDNPNAMWNWNGLYRENLAGNYQAGIPDGTLCSGGNAEGGRYNSLDAIGPWTTTQVANSFQIRLFDQASHGADYIRVYVTRQGFDALNQPLRWSDLELVGQIGNTPASQWRQVTSGVEIDVPANAPGRTGRHIVYTIWLASHLDQAYFLCSDVTFPGGPNEPPPSSPPPVTSPPVTSPPVTSPPVTSPPVTSPPPVTSSPPVTGACAATYTTVSQWGGGFQGEIQVTAGASGVSGWSVTVTFPGNQQIQQAWNATVSGSGPTYTIQNVGYNGALSAGGSTTFGFLGSGTAGTPTVSCSAT